MPVTHLGLLIITVLALAGLTVWALLAWGAGTVVPLLSCIALIARWGMTPVGRDDRSA